MNDAQKKAFNDLDKKIIDARNKRDNDEKVVAGYDKFTNNQKIVFDWGLLEFKMQKYFACKAPLSAECVSADKLRVREELTKKTDGYYAKDDAARLLDDKARDIARKRFFQDIIEANFEKDK